MGDGNQCGHHVQVSVLKRLKRIVPTIGSVMSPSSHIHVIPKIIHQLWIGPRPPPTKMMASWKEKHPDYEYILWNEEELVRRGIELECLDIINDVDALHGKADIIRWEILYQYGGIFLDADSYCLEPLDPDLFLTKPCWATYENENMREGLIANGNMGTVAGHPLIRAIIDTIKLPGYWASMEGYQVWYVLGPGLLTRQLNTGNYPDVCIFPSYMFLPHHFTGIKYRGYKKVYAYQAWGSTYNNYEELNDLAVPRDLLPPDRWISVLIPSYNTPRAFLRDCLNSIRDQHQSADPNRIFGMELVWVDDGSDEHHLHILQEELARFERRTRFIQVKFVSLGTNMGVADALRLGMKQCSHALVARMDSDDIMVPHRLLTQFEYMMSMMAARQPVAICGAGIRVFEHSEDEPDPKTRRVVRDVVHPSITWDEYLAQPRQSWVTNHPTWMMDREAIMDVGGYYAATDLSGQDDVPEDVDLVQRVLARYHRIVNLPDILLWYRMHPDQVSSGSNFLQGGVP